MSQLVPLAFSKRQDCLDRMVILMSPSNSPLSRANILYGHTNSYYTKSQLIVALRLLTSNLSELIYSTVVGKHGHTPYAS